MLSLPKPNKTALTDPAVCDTQTVVPRTRLQLGNREFCVAGPVAWNSLPLDIRSAPTYQRYKTCSRHIIFSRSYLTDLQAFQSTRAANIVRRSCSGSSHVTAPYKSPFYYYYYYYY